MAARVAASASALERGLPGVVANHQFISNNAFIGGQNRLAGDARSGFFREGRVRLSAHGVFSSYRQAMS